MANADKGQAPGRSLSSAERREALSQWRKRIVKMETKVRPPQRIFPPTEADKIRHSTRGPSTVHYLTSGPVKAKDPPNPYKLAVLPKMIRSKGYDAPTHRWREHATLRERLRVSDNEEEKERVERKVKHQPEIKRIREKFIRKKYEEELKKRTLNNILAGYIQDDIMMKTENSITAQVAIKQAQKEIDNASKSMAEFLSQEQKNCENLTKKLADISEVKKKRQAQIESEMKKMSEVKLRIFRQSEMLGKMRKCREFVLEVAPEEWKKEYEKETTKRQEEVKDDVYKLNRALHNYKTNCAGEDIGLEKVLEDFIKEYSTAGPPSLPYDDPKRVFGLFKDLELKSLRTLHHNAGLKRDIEKMNRINEKFDAYFDNQKAEIDSMMREINEKICKEKAIVEEKKLLLENVKKGPFRKMVASEEALKEHILIKDIYEELIDKPKENLDTLEMLQEIGELYIDLNRRLEKVPLEKKEKLEKQAKRALEKGMLEAERAERRKKQIENMMKGLRRAREKPWVRTGKPVQFISVPSTLPKYTEIQQGEEQIKTTGMLRQDLESNFHLVFAVNHPGPGPYRQPSPPRDLLADYEKYYPDIQITDTDEDEVLISDSEEEKEGKKKLDPAEEKKKVKRKKVKKIIDSDESN